MKTLEEEAIEYANELVEARVIKDYQSGWMESVYLYITRSSKWVQAENIKAQIDVLKLTHLRLSVEGIDKVDGTMVFTINELEQQLKQLEDDGEN
jgi:hypothetical protein